MDFDADILLEGATVATSAVRPDTSGHVRFVLESLSDGITVTGTVTFPWVGECRRCLEPTEGVGTAELLEVFKDQPISDDTLPLDGDFVDLRPVVRDAVVLALPLAPLCGPDCTGPDPDAYPVAIEGVTPPPPDPRWSALSELTFASDDEGESEPE